MNVIPPLTITDAMLINSTVSEPDSGSPTTEAVYSAAITYALGDVVVDTTAHVLYESLLDGNIGNVLADTTKWLLLGPSNKWAMFDLLRNTATKSPGAITVVIAPGVRVDSIALLGLVGSSVTISVDSAIGSPSENYYTHTEDLAERNVVSWYDYFFNPFTYRPNIVRFDLPPYSTAYITATINGSNVECGALVIGTYQYIGDVQAEAESDVLNFSSVTRDFAGKTNLMVQRRNVPKTSQTLLIDKSLVNAVRVLRDALNAAPAVWAGVADDTNGYFDALLILGFYKRFTINLKLPDNAVISLDLEEI